MQVHFCTGTDSRVRAAILRSLYCASAPSHLLLGFLHCPSRLRWHGWTTMGQVQLPCALLAPLRSRLSLPRMAGLYRSATFASRRSWASLATSPTRFVFMCLARCVGIPAFVPDHAVTTRHSAGQQAWRQEAGRRVAGDVTRTGITALLLILLVCVWHVHSHTPCDHTYLHDTVSVEYVVILSN